MGSWLGSLSIDDWRRQRERQKAIGLDWQNKQLCTCITPFLYISLPSLHDYDVKIPNFDSRFLEDVNTKQRLPFSFPEQWYSLLEFNSRKTKKRNADIWWTEGRGFGFFSSLVLHLCIFFLVGMYLSLFLSFCSLLFFFCLLFFFYGIAWVANSHRKK